MVVKLWHITQSLPCNSLAISVIQLWLTLQYGIYVALRSMRVVVYDVYNEWYSSKENHTIHDYHNLYRTQCSGLSHTNCRCTLAHNHMHTSSIGAHTACF